MTEPYIPSGTQLMALKPSSILAAAEADIRRHQRNSKIWQRSNGAEGGVQHYAFHREHVRRATRRNELATGADIIRQALTGLSLGRESGKPMTRELYRDEGLLRQAAGESGGAQK